MQAQAVQGQPVQGQLASTAADVQRAYAKRNVRVAMRDGTQLFTSVYTPQDTSKRYPIMLMRTPYGGFDQPRDGPVTVYPSLPTFPTGDGYNFFLGIGPVKNLSPDILKHRVAFWDSIMVHPNHDAY